MNLAQSALTLALLGDENRLRLCALLRQRDLCVSDLVRVTGLPQSGVSTHLGRLREAGIVHDRRHGAQSFYAIAAEQLPAHARVVIDEAARSDDPTLLGDRQRLAALEAASRGAHGETLIDGLERDYSPGRSWQSLAAGLSALLRLGDVLDVGCGEGAATACIAPHCRSLIGVDINERLVQRARERLSGHDHVRIMEADAHDLPFQPASFDAVLMFHTLTYAAQPPQAIAECARVLRPGGRLVVLCLDKHRKQDVSARHGEVHPGFAPKSVRTMLERALLETRRCDVATREARKPHLQVVLAIADKPATASEIAA